MGGGCREPQRPPGSAEIIVGRSALLTAALLLVLAPLTALPTAAQGPLTIGIDADPSGNGATVLGPIEPCISVRNGDTFDVDVFVRDVEELLAFEMYIEFNPQVVEVVDRDVSMFLAGNPGSSVLDVSAPVPNRDGLYRAAAADTSDPPTPDSGSGVLFRLTLRAVGPGSSGLVLAVRDVDGDGAADIGPLLRNVDAEVLGDLNGDTIFDGPIGNARVVVDSPCPELPAAPGPTPAPSSPAGDSGGTSAAVVAIAAGGGAAALLAAGLGAFLLARRRASP